MKAFCLVFLVLLCVGCSAKWDVGAGSAEIRKVADEKAD